MVTSMPARASVCVRIDQKRTGQTVGGVKATESPRSSNLTRVSNQS